MHPHRNFLHCFVEASRERERDYFFERVRFRSDFRANAIRQKYWYKVYRKIITPLCPG